jgi:hypothetical protein
MPTCNQLVLESKDSSNSTLNNDTFKKPFGHLMLWIARKSRLGLVPRHAHYSLPLHTTPLLPRTMDHPQKYCTTFPLKASHPYWRFRRVFGDMPDVVIDVFEELQVLKLPPLGHRLDGSIISSTTTKCESYNTHPRRLLNWCKNVTDLCTNILTSGIRRRHPTCWHEAQCDII